MNKSFILATALATLALAGCQNLEDQIGNKLAEGIINTASNGEVKVKIDDLEKGKINVETKDGTISLDGTGADGTFKVTDSSGKTVVEGSGDGDKVVIKDESGKEVVKSDGTTMTITDDDGNVSKFEGGEGTGRPTSAPADMPSLDGATDFNYFTYSGMSSLTFAMADENLKGYCDQLTSKVEGAGWATSKEGFSFEGEDSIAKNYEKGPEFLAVMCGLNDGKTTLGLQKTAKE